MKLTTNDLRKKKYGTACGAGGNTIESKMRTESLSQPIVIEFIDEFFNGELFDVELEGNELCGAQAEIHKSIYDQEFIDKYLKLSIDNNIFDLKDLAEFMDVSVKKIKNFKLSIDDVNQLICWCFMGLVSVYHGSLRVDYMGDNMVDIESE